MMLLVLAGGGKAFAQSTYTINSVNGQTITTTSALFYDSGGVSGSYSNNESYTVTFNSGTSDKMSVAFTSFSTEATFDYLYVYDGSSTSAPQVVGSPFNGTTSPGTIVSTSNCLTFKFTSDASVTSSGWAATITTVSASDYGDYSNFGSASATVSTKLFMGTNPTDADGPSPVTNSTATGDDTTGTDDEDLTQPTMTAGATASLSVPVFNNTGSTAYLSIWIDYNNNGVLTDSGEKVVNNLSVASSSVTQNLVLNVSIPSTATQGTPIGMRYRLDSTSGVASTGIGGIGEVEDYVVTIAAPTLDFGDYSGFASASSTASMNLRMGATVDAEGAATSNSTATGDDITGTDDEDGVTLPSFLTAGVSSSITVNVTNTTGATAYLNAWIDFNNNGVVTDAGEQIATNVAIPTGTSGANQVITFTTPAGATITTVGARFRLTSTSAPGATGFSGTGEVEDYVIPIQPAMSIGNCVWNDANDNGVKDSGETGIGGVTLQLYSSGADNTVNTADDTLVASTTSSITGAYLFSGLPAGKYYVKLTPPSGYPMTSGTPVTTDNDVDNNNDGSQPGGAGTAIYSPIITLSPGTESVTDGDTDANTNLTIDFGLFTGFTVGNLVFADVNNNGVFDSGETGISGLTVELLNSSGNSFSPAVTTTTNSSGAYSFTVYSPGTYKVKVTPNATYPIASSTVGTDNGTDNNNDGTQPGVGGTASTSFSFTLTGGGEPGTSGTTNLENTIDFGFHACPTITVTPSTLANGVVGTSYTQSTVFTASGGTSPYTWTTPATLPAGMAWDTTNHKLTGAPLFTGTTNVVVAVTDAKGCTGSVTVPFMVCILPSIKPDSLPTGTLGSAYSSTLAATESGFDLQQSFSSVSGGITNLATADALLSGTTRASNWTGAGAVVNFMSSAGGDGHYVSTVFPAGAGDDFAVRATGIITIATAGTYTFGINSDDGNRLKIDGVAVITSDVQQSAADDLGTVTLTAGTHTIEAEFFERAGGEAFELWAIAGSKSSWSSSFALVGSATGIQVVRTSPTYTWALTSGSLPTGLSLNTSTGAVTGTPTTAGSYTFTITATDNSGCTNSKSYTVTTACPTLTMTPAAGALTQGTVGSVYSQAMSSTGSFGTLTWSVSSGTLPAGLSISSSTGAITGTPTTATSGTSGSSISITAVDQYGCSVTKAYTLKVCPVLSFSPASTLPGATVGTAYSQTVTAGNGTGPYTWAVSSGTLPSGLTLGSSGVISGTPTSTASKTFTIQATDANGCTGTVSYTLAPVCPTLAFSPASMVTGTVGSAYSQTIIASNGTSPYTWAVSSGTLPAGLSLASGTGIVSGTPTASNNAGVPIGLKATDTYGCSNTVNYTLQVCPVLTFSPASTLPTATVGSTYSQAIVASSGVAPYTYSVTSGTLPAGLSLSSTGTLSGTPTSTTSRTFTVQAVDTYNCSNTVTYTMVPVCPVITLTPTTSIATGTVQSSYSQTLTASGGTAPYTWAVSVGTLPAGLSLSAAGVISGTPTASNGAGTSVTFAATDKYGCSGNITYSNFKICPIITLSPAVLPVGTVGTAYTGTVTQSGGATPALFAVTSGTLPAGLSLASSGAISGTPTVSNGAGTTITFGATDANGCPGSIQSLLQICPVIGVSPASFATATVGTPYTQTLTASNGASPYAWSVLSGTLPAGLSLSTGGVLSGTPTSTATQTFTVQALDNFGCPGTKTYTLTPVCPVIALAPSPTLATGTAGTAYSQTLTASGGNGPYTWTVSSGTLPAGLSLSAGGVISGTPTVSNGAGISIAFAAADIYGCSANITYSNFKICPVITLSPPVLAVGTVGTAYSAAVTQSGGATPATFAITGGTLPAGLSLAASGAITGTPTASNGGGVNITFTATDANSCQGSMLSLLQICPVITAGPSTLGIPVVGSSYSQTLSASGGATSYTWTVVSGTLPAGLSLSSTGVISGTATSTTTQNFTVQAADVNGCPGTHAYTMTPVCPVVTVTPATVAVGTVGSTYTQALLVTGGTAPYTWAVQSGTLPAGLTLNASTGAISGTPTASNGGGLPVTFQASDVYGCPGAVTVTMKICPIITITPASPLPTATLGVAYTQTLTASGGAPSYTWKVTSGSLPPGLSMSTAGVISGTPTVVASYNFTVQALDANSCPGTLAYVLPVACPPIILSPSTLTVGTVGISYTQSMSASGGTGPYAWTVSSGTLPSGLTLSGGGVISGTPTASNGAGVNVGLTATDSNPNACSGVNTYLFKICPVIALSPATLPPLTVGASYSQAVTASGGAAPYTYSVFSGTLPSWASLNASTGVISGTPNTTASSTFIISATDKNGCPGLLSYTVAAGCPTITSSPSSLPAATVGTAYSATLTGSGGSAPYHFAVTSGALPSWASLNTATGVISGTPNGTTSATFVITVSDNYSCTGTRSYTLAPVCPAISLAPTTLPTATVGTAYSGTSTASGGTSPYTYAITAGTLPAGLSFSAASGQVSGTPSAATSGVNGVALTIRAVDSLACQGSQVVNLKVCPVITVLPTSSSAGTGTVGTPYSTSLVSSGGTAPYTYALTSGTLPPGLSMTSGGVVTGTPTTAVSANVTVTATDANGCTGTLSGTIAVSCPVITITPAATLMSATAGTPFGQTLTATGGTAPYTWTLTSGPLPQGLSLSSGGVISGTPSASNGPGAPITVQASDNYGCVATKSYTIKVCPVLAFNPASLPTGAIGVAYSQTVSALNGAAPYVYSISSGTLPGGLTLNSGSGVISGTPTAGNGSGAPITVQAVDANSCPGTMNYTLKVCPVITVGPSSLSGAVVGTSYSQTITASGGAPSYSFSISSGSLPSWASLNSSTGVISGTPNTTSGAAFTVTATDLNGCTGARSYTMAPACPGLLIVPASLIPGTVGTPYSQAFTASNGASPYSWTTISGTLPAGLSLSNGGLLNGTPTASNGAGVPLTIQSTDSLGCSSSRSYNLKICPIITVSPGSLPPFVVGASYSQTFSASGGGGSYVYSVTGGALPSWAALNSSTGVLSGTPNSNTAATFTITATDVNNCSGSTSYTMVLLSLKVGNLVWSDLNNNGVKDAGENGIANVTVQLWSSGPNGVPENGGGDDVKVMADVVTDSNGRYLFDGVPAGSGYYVCIPVVPPTNAVTSGTPVDASNNVDNDNNGQQPNGPGTSVYSSTFSISPGTNPDVGVDGDDTNGNLTIDFGLAPTQSVGNLVFKDVDDSGTFNASVDAPIDGVILQLFAQGADPTSDNPVATTVTANGGLYLFSVLAGNYFVYVPPSQFINPGPLYGMKPSRGRTDNTVPNVDDDGDQNALATAKPMATGVRTGVFTLASGVEPTAASGETGYHATSDDSYDTNANLTVDLGFYPVPAITAPLAGRVRRDLTGTGDPDAATTPLPGVEIALYEDTNGNGKLDPEEMTAVDSTVTNTSGTYSFSAVPAGDYLVVQTVLPGAEATFDSDGGDADTTAITISGDPVVEVNFMQALTPDTFALWQQLHPSLNQGATDNPDGDMAANLLEYALGTEASSGAGTPHFWVEAHADGTADALLLRNTAGHHDIRYVMEGSNDLAIWQVLAAAPAVTPLAGGTETVRYTNVGTAFVRLRVNLDANQDGTPEATALSTVQGWSLRQFSASAQTFSMPLLKPEVFAGTASSATGKDFVAGQAYYAEVISGNLEGRRFEVDEAHSTDTALAFESSSPPADARIAVRAHWLVKELFPITNFHAGTSSANADRVMFFNGTAYTVYWLMNRPGGGRWVRDGDATMADLGSTIVGPLDGLLVNPRNAVSIALSGEVRSWKAALPLRAGPALVGSGYPLALSPAARGMNGTGGFVAGDSFRLWLGDSSSSASGYANNLFDGARWTGDAGADVTASKVFDGWHAAYLISSQGNAAWQEPLPWAP